MWALKNNLLCSNAVRHNYLEIPPTQFKAGFQSNSCHGPLQTRKGNISQKSHEYCLCTYTNER